MSTPRTVKKWAMMGIMLTPFFLILGIAQVSNTVMDIWRDVLVFCMSQKDIFFTYLSHPDTAMTIFIASLFSIGLLYGLFFLIVQVYRVHQLKKELSRNAISVYGYGSIEKSLKIVNDKRSFALTFGFFHPTIYISNGLLTKLSAQELRSVMVHERYHQKHHHPVCILALNTLKSMLFFLPVAKNIVTKVTTQYELLADEAAITETSRSTLARALVKILDGNRDFSRYEYAISSFTTFSNRVEAITNGGASVHPLRISRFLSFVSIGLILLFSFFLIGAHTEFAQAGSISNHTVFNEQVSSNYCNGPDQTIFNIIQSTLPI